MKGRPGFGLGGCAMGDGPTPDAEGSVFTRLTEGAPFLPLSAGGRPDNPLDADDPDAVILGLIRWSRSSLAKARPDRYSPRLRPVTGTVAPLVEISPPG